MTTLDNPYRTPGRAYGPGYIRYIANTDDSALGTIALSYLRALTMIAPVRLVTMTGALVGGWAERMALLTTPMLGTFVNVVCCSPERWVWRQQVPMPAREDPPPPDLFDKRSLEIMRGEVEWPPRKIETVTGWAELYTERVHNVLIVAGHISDPKQVATAAKYQVRIAPTIALATIINTTDPPTPIQIVRPDETDRIRKLIAT